MTKNIENPPHYIGSEPFRNMERRKNTTDRRKTDDRRSQEERRLDSRLSAVKQRKTIKIWLRTLTHSRLGVDRRKKEDRRVMGDRRQQPMRSILTTDEIADLLSS